MKKAAKYALASTLLVALFLIPYKVLKHRAPERSFSKVQDLPEPLSPHDSLIRMYADSIGWDWRLVAAVIRQESQFRSQAVSPGGTVGLMQIQSSRYSRQTLLDPEQNIRIGTRYLQTLEQMFSAASALDTLKFTLAAYNMGDEKMRKLRADATARGLDAEQWDQVLPHRHQSRRYVNSVLRHYEHYLATQPSGARLRALSDTIPTN